MPVSYTNRKGKTYTLYCGQTRAGKPRYYFGRPSQSQGEPVSEIPPGYSISESVNGVVSLVKDRPRIPSCKMGSPPLLVNLLLMIPYRPHIPPRQLRVLHSNNSTVSQAEQNLSSDLVPAEMQRIWLGKEVLYEPVP